MNCNIFLDDVLFAETHCLRRKRIYENELILRGAQLVSSKWVSDNVLEIRYATPEKTKPSA